MNNKNPYMGLVETKYNNKLTDAQLLVFNYVLNSFPETVLTKPDGTDNDQVFDLLALIAYIIGDRRESILITQYAHSVDELIDRIEEIESGSNELNKKYIPLYKALLVKYALDKSPELIDEGKTFEEIYDDLLLSYNLLRNKKFRDKNVGNLTYLVQTVADAIKADPRVYPWYKDGGYKIVPVIYKDKNIVYRYNPTTNTHELVDLNEDPTPYEGPTGAGPGVVLEICDLDDNITTLYNIADDQDPNYVKPEDLIDFNKGVYGDTTDASVFYVNRNFSLYKSIIKGIPAGVDVDIVIGAPMTMVWDDPALYKDYTLSRDVLYIDTGQPFTSVADFIDYLNDSNNMYLNKLPVSKAVAPYDDEPSTPSKYWQDPEQDLKEWNYRYSTDLPTSFETININDTGADTMEDIIAKVESAKPANNPNSPDIITAFITDFASQWSGKYLTFAADPIVPRIIDGFEPDYTHVKILSIDHWFQTWEEFFNYLNTEYPPTGPMMEDGDIFAMPIHEYAHRSTSWPSSNIVFSVDKPTITGDYIDITDQTFNLPKAMADYLNANANYKKTPDKKYAVATSTLGGYYIATAVQHYDTIYRWGLAIVRETDKPNYVAARRIAALD